MVNRRAPDKTHPRQPAPEHPQAGGRARAEWRISCPGAFATHHTAARARTHLRGPTAPSYAPDSPPIRRGPGRAVVPPALDEVAVKIILSVVYL